MTQAAESNLNNRADADEVRQQLTGKHVCPFCGVIRTDQAQPCPRCTMEDTSATRSATRQRIGPWFVLQARNPSAPGMRFVTLLSLVKKNHVTPRSIVRGPTTHQLWTFAANVRGLSREFGLCHHCGEAVDALASTCRHCDQSQEAPADPDMLLESAPGAPEFQVTAGVNPETGMDGGTSLDLQLDDGFGISPRPSRPTRPVIASVPATTRSAFPIERSKSEEPILSARELAAAFQLDFKAPPAQRTAAASRPAPVAPQLPAPVGKSTPHRKPKILVTTLIIAVVATGIFLAIRPDYRGFVAGWLSSSWSSIKSSLDTPAQKAPPPVTPRVEVKVDPKPTPKPAELPAPTPIVKPEPKPEPVVKVEPKPEPKPEPAPVVKPEPPKPEPKAPLTIEQAIPLARQLRSQAIDAESRRDWWTALNLYEQIEQLPKEAWPSDLQRRLTAARSRTQ